METSFTLGGCRFLHGLEGLPANSSIVELNLGKQHLCFESAFQAELLKSQLSVSFVPRREEDRRDPMPSGQKCQRKENTGQLRKKKGR